jgi:hypothetical protein
MIQHSNLFSRLVREPLVHFLVLGAALFLLYGYVGDDGAERADRIVVDEAEIQRLAEQFQRTWMRPPSRQELEGLAEDYVKEEIFYREALALGLDQDDLVIRRRMRQKMEFLNADLVEQQVPGEAELQAYLDAHPDKFRQPARFSFEQIYLSTGQNPDSAQRKAAALLLRLQAEPESDWQALGDPTLLPVALYDASVRDIAASFGRALANTIPAAPLNRWSGPYASEYGLHLVKVSEHTPASLPKLNEIRTLVEREWGNEHRQQANERFYQALRERYAVEIRLPDATAGDKLAVHRP